MEKVFDIHNLHCADCGRKIEEAINRIEEIESAVLDFTMKKISIRADEHESILEKINAEAKKIESDVEIVSCTEHIDHEHHHHDHEECSCGHDHDHEHHHHDHEECSCGHDHDHEHHHHDHEDCGCGHDHEHEHHHHGHHHEHKEMTVQYTINNLDCAHCGAKIEEALGKLEGIEKAELNYPLRKLTIHGAIDDDTLRVLNEAANRIEPGVEIVPRDMGKGQQYTINNLDCAHCGAKIEEALGRLEGIDSVSLNFPMKRITVHGSMNADMLKLMNETAGAIEPGVEIVPYAPEHTHEAHTESNDKKVERSGLKKEAASLIIGAVLFAAAVLLSKFTDMKLVYIIPYIAAYLILGRGVLTATVRNIKAKNFFDENFLMTVATIGAFILGEYSEAVGVVLFFRIGELFENYAVAKSRKAITDVAELRVDEADVMRNGEYVRISSDDIRAGDILRIKTGERIAADGVVVSGDSRIDTSAVNGEPVPVSVHPGDEVLSGCINLSDTFTLKASAAASDSMISKIALAVEDASASKPKIDRFITRFSRVYTPIVIGTAVLTAVLGTIITGDWQKWIYSALTFLVISCPCALVLSVPLAYFSGIGAASKLGILFKGGDAIEALGKVRTIAFDKTGTLTNGSFTVTRVDTCGELDEEQLLRICGSCEQVSSHPVAESITDECKKRGIAVTEPEKSGELAGRGVSAVIDGHKVLCGNERLINENGAELPELSSAEIGSVVYIAIDGKAAGRIIVSDTVKKTSAEAISQLNSMGLETVMLTGDKTANAEAVGKQLGIGRVKGDLMPDGKLEEIGRIRRETGAVMFVGDGINDGPVLAGADVGGAMQTGADLALEAADAVFMSSEPESIVKAKKIANKTLRISYENIIFALIIKGLVMLAGLLGYPNMWFAVFADSGVAMLLILNSIRVLNTKKYR